MKLSFRRPAEPAPLDKDALISQLSHDKAALRTELDQVRDELAEANRLVAYQRGRMKDMAAQVLGSQATVARYAAVTEMFLSDRGVKLPPPGASSVGDVASVVPHECWHPTAEHGYMGCVVGNCKCVVPRHVLDKAKTR